MGHVWPHPSNSEEEEDKEKEDDDEEGETEKKDDKKEKKIRKKKKEKKDNKCEIIGAFLKIQQMFYMKWNCLCQWRTCLFEYCAEVTSDHKW